LLGRNDTAGYTQVEGRQKKGNGTLLLLTENAGSQLSLGPTLSCENLSAVTGEISALLRELRIENFEVNNFLDPRQKTKGAYPEDRQADEEEDWARPPSAGKYAFLSIKGQSGH